MARALRGKAFDIVVGERPRPAEVIALYGAVGWGGAGDYDEGKVQAALSSRAAT